MNWEVIITMTIVYVIGVVLSLIFLNKYGKQLGWGDYDPPHGDWYDDYPSNAHAWLAFSTIWPIFYAFNILFGIHKLCLMFSRYVYKKYNG